jgi:serine/threonine/tyrosine-interacting protein
MRHQCQEILPGLLLGPFQVSKNLASLKELGISHMYAFCLQALAHRPELSFTPSCSLAHSVCIRDVKEAFSVRPRFPESFEYLVLDVQDSEEQNLIRLFPRLVWQIIAVSRAHVRRHSRAQQFINAALSRSGRVLVHCNGKSLLSSRHNQ